MCTSLSASKNFNFDTKIGTIIVKHLLSWNFIRPHHNGFIGKLCNRLIWCSIINFLALNKLLPKFRFILTITFIDDVIIWYDFYNKWLQRVYTEQELQYFPFFFFAYNKINTHIHSHRYPIRMLTQTICVREIVCKSNTKTVQSYNLSYRRIHISNFWIAS